ncbi:MAG: PIN domain-containing protein [Cyanobacteria bacterium J06638_22]
MKVLFDTTVLVAGTLTQHPNHEPCFVELQRVFSGQHQGYLSTHSLAETYSVLTRLPIQPRISPANAESIIQRLLQYLEPVALTSKNYQAAIAQMTTLNLAGGAIFDALIAQAALNISAIRLLTLNPNHFTRLGAAIAQITEVPQ